MPTNFVNLRDRALLVHNFPRPYMENAAATAEQVWVGWVSFYEPGFLRELVGLPEQIKPVAWLCVGPVSAFQQVPDLERFGWRSGRSLTEAVHHETFGN